MEIVTVRHTTKGASKMKITTIGVDLAKNVFQIHGVDNHGKVVLRKKLSRSKLLEFFLTLQPCLIGIEACGSAHYWARKFVAIGYTVKLMAPQFVKPYVKTNKNDVADAEAICEAVSRPNMRFVAIKTEEQQAILSLHRVRQGFVKARTAQSNQIRGLLSEFGLIMPKGVANIASRLPELLETTCLPGSFREFVATVVCAFQGTRQAGRRVGSENSTMASEFGCKSATGGGSRNRADHSQCTDRVDWRCLQLR